MIIDSMFLWKKGLHLSLINIIMMVTKVVMLIGWKHTFFMKKILWIMLVAKIGLYTC